MDRKYCTYCAAEGRDPHPTFYIDQNGCERCPHDGCGPQGFDAAQSSTPTKSIHPDPDIPLTEGNFETALRWHTCLVQRARQVCALLGIPPLFLTFNREESGTFLVEWVQDSTHENGVEIVRRILPTRYLWMTDEAIQTDEAQAALDFVARRAEFARRRRLRRAKEALAQAEIDVSTAQERAQAALEKARAEVEALTFSVEDSP